jgi:hypothetical protein
VSSRPAASAPLVEVRRQVLVRHAVAKRSHVSVDALGLAVDEVHGSLEPRDGGGKSIDSLLGSPRLMECRIRQPRDGGQAGPP